MDVMSHDRLGDEIGRGGMGVVSPSTPVSAAVLLIGGKNDFQAPLDSQTRFIELFGTPKEHKKWVTLEGGHVPNDYRGMVREALDWYDKYLGPVK